MLQNTIETWIGIAGFGMFFAALVVWFVRRQVTKPRLNIPPSVETDRRGTQELHVRLENLKSSPGQVRSAYLMFESGAGMALRPALAGSAMMPLTLPRAEYANLRYDFETMSIQLSHHQAEKIHTVACLMDNDDLVGHPVPAPVTAALRQAAEAAAPTHLQTCPGCSDFTAVFPR